MRQVVPAIIIAASLTFGAGALAQTADHSDHHPPATGNSTATPPKPPAPTASGVQMKCPGVMGGKMSAGMAARQAKPPGSPAGSVPEQQEKRCAGMMANMHVGQGKAPN